MARARNHGNGRLEEAMTNLLLSRTTLGQTQISLLARIAEIDRVSSERFARIEAILAEHRHILAEHTRILGELTRYIQALPDAIRDKIGFKPPQPTGL
jgi:hypothetical protein